MARLKTETLTLKLVVNGDETRKKINDLEKSVINSRDSIKEMRKEMENLAKQGQTDSARYKELTAAIKTENEAIKKNTASLNELRSKLSLNDMTIKELSGRIKTLRNELARTKPDTKEWEQLNQELKAASARMHELGSGSKYTGGILESLGKSVVPTFDVVTLGLKAIHAAGSILKKGLQDLVSDTQKFADAWQMEVAAVEAVWHHFIRRISSSRDEITLTYQEVAKLAREAAALKDEIFELQNSYNIREAEATTRMQELEAIFRDTTLSIEERKAALDEMKQLELDLANDRLLIAKQSEDAAYEEFEIETALNRKAAESFIENYLQAKKDGIVDAAVEFEHMTLRLQYLNDVVSSGAFFSKSTYQNIYDEQEQLRKKIAETSTEVKTFFETYRQYNLGEDAVTAAYAQAIMNTRRASAAADPSAMDRKYVRMNSQLKRSSTGSGGSSAAAKRAEKERKAAEEARKAAEDAAKEEAELAKLSEQILQTRIASLTDYNEKADAQIDAENARFEKEMKELEKKKDKMADYNHAVEVLQLQHDNNLLKIELDRQSAEMKELESDHKLRLAEIQRENEYELQLDTTSSARKIEIKKERDKKIAEENLRFAKQQYDFLLKIVTSGEVAGLALTKEQLDQYRLKLEEVRKALQDADAAAENLTGSSMWSGTGDASLFGIKQSDWEAFFQNLKDGTLKAKDLQTAINGIGGMAQEGFKLANQAIKLTNANEKKALDEYKKGQDSRKKSLEERFRAGLMTESQYNAEVEQMEADLQAKQEEAELEQARRTKTMSIIESIINTALAATKALAQGGFPAGAVMAGIVTALGAAQTAMIAAQPVGFAGGGFIVRRRQDGKQYDAVYAPDKRGYVDGPTVLVGEEGGEYVIPAEALQNPQIRMIADTIESARRMGRLRSLRMEAISPSLAISGRSMGGYTRTSASAAFAEPMEDTYRLAASIDRLNTLLDKGIRADVSMLGRNGFVERLNEYNRMRRRGQL